MCIVCTQLLNMKSNRDIFVKFERSELESKFNPGSCLNLHVAGQSQHEVDVKDRLSDLKNTESHRLHWL